MNLDPRLHAYREDLAGSYLRERVRAARYIDGEPRQIAAPSIPIRVAPKFDAPLATEALSGEILTLFDVRDGWGWVQLQDDRYVGYTPMDGLSTMIEENSHRVSARLTYLYPAPDIKRPPITKLSFSCTVLPISRPDARFFELSRGGFVHSDHLVGIKERAKDYVRIAERFVGAPYLWGGKTTLGIDCSGLVQISVQAAGMSCPRDSDMQLATIGESIDPANLDGVQRGDLLFWKGHVAIAQSGDWIVHASGHHMEVVVEPIRRAIERIAESYGQLAAIKRPVFEQQPQLAGQAGAVAKAIAQQAGLPQAENGVPAEAEKPAAPAAPQSNRSREDRVAAFVGNAAQPGAPKPNTAEAGQAGSEKFSRWPGPSPRDQRPHSPASDKESAPHGESKPNRTSPAG